MGRQPLSPCYLFHLLLQKKFPIISLTVKRGNHGVKQGFWLHQNSFLRRGTGKLVKFQLCTKFTEQVGVLKVSWSLLFPPQLWICCRFVGCKGRQDTCPATAVQVSSSSCSLGKCLGPGLEQASGAALLLWHCWHCPGGGHGLRTRRVCVLLSLQ